MPVYSIAVAGAGPAGLSAALLLHRDGHRVKLFERFDVPRPIGSGLMLQPTGLAVLDKLGLAHHILAQGHRIDRLFGRLASSDRVVLDVRYRNLDDNSFGVAVHRALLFDPLFDAVRHEGIPIETACAIGGLAHGDERPSLVTEAGRRTEPFDLVIDATGARSAFAVAYGGRPRRELTYGALWTTLKWPHGRFEENALEQRYDRASTMVGVLPIGRPREGAGEQTAFFWSIRPPDYDDWRRQGLVPWKMRVLRVWPQTAPLLDAIIDPDQMTLARYSHHTLANPVVGCLVAIGDSAHAASPQLGQGANMAMLDAWALSSALRTTNDLSTALRAYTRLRWAHVRFYQVMSALFTPFYQSDSKALPVLRDWLLAPATRLPLARMLVAAMVAGVMFDPRKKLGLDQR
jgi:2-polyprenyl-6-methoxyphenol hydroxylase-like FAD-dependent oxidoreductase